MARRSPDKAQSRQDANPPKGGPDGTYRTREALPAILPPERFHCSRPIPNGLLALLALWQTQSHVALLAIRMASIDGKPYTVLTTTEVTVSRESLSAY